MQLAFMASGAIRVLTNVEGLPFRDLAGQPPDHKIVPQVFQAVLPHESDEPCCRKKQATTNPENDQSHKQSFSHPG